MRPSCLQGIKMQGSLGTGLVTISENLPFIFQSKLRFHDHWSSSNRKPVKKFQHFRKETNEESKSSSEKPFLNMEEIVNLRGPDLSKNNTDENLIIARTSLEDDA